MRVVDQLIDHLRRTGALSGGQLAELRRREYTAHDDDESGNLGDTDEPDDDWHRLADRIAAPPRKVARGGAKGEGVPRRRGQAPRRRGSRAGRCGEVARGGGGRRGRPWAGC